MTTTERERWEIPVHDAVLMRPRHVVVAVAETRVVLLPPPGEGFVLSAESIRLLRDALMAALSVAEHRKRGYRTDESGGQR